ncbi:hypothetical protein N8289_00580 [Flavobacteriales bacterium]|nr:hypothetical protein [bacterium]MDA9303988.1 hypothetical protein [bacterium]MDB4052174.1 hypothetical protein [Flavobacteriales bacterium]MDC1370312.1 hypothetical protein [Flavobacteriales bacterium]
MAKKDLGLGNDFQENEKRFFNKDGSFNVRKIGLLTGVRDIYVYLTEIS